MDLSKLSDKVLAKFARRAPGTVRVLQALPESGAHGVSRDQLIAAFEHVSQEVVKALDTRGVQWKDGE